jgi:hypothetical protein
VVEYFWHKCVNAGNPKGLTEEHFRYPGMKPPTKETAILMLVDSIEAASRTIDPPERDKFEEMIQRIIFTKLRTGQLDESGLTLADLRILVTRMSDTLVNMFHHRIRYPWQDQRRVVTHFTTPLPGPVSSIAARGSFASLPPDTQGSQPTITLEKGFEPPRESEPPPSIHTIPLSLVPPLSSSPPGPENPPSTAPQKKT